jgi:hypothetical protein
MEQDRGSAFAQGFGVTGYPDVTDDFSLNTRKVERVTPGAPLYPPVVRLKRAFCPFAVLPPDSFRPAAGRLLALQVKAQCRQSRLACELDFVVSCLFFRLGFDPRRPRRGCVWPSLSSRH